MYCSRHAITFFTRFAKYTSLGTYFAIVTCRNSRTSIEKAVVSLIEQTVRPNYIIIIDDGSTDATADIIKNMQEKYGNIHIITNPDLGYDIGRVVSNWNKAIAYARENKLPDTEYHMIATDDTIYEKDYAEKILMLMDADSSLAVASGDYAGQDAHAPHGAGRFVKNSFFNKHHGLYPEKMGYESLMLYSASKHGFRSLIVKDARFVHLRPLGKNHNFYQFGASMRTLGYHPFFVLGRFLKYFLTGKPIGRKGSLYMLYYYLSYRPKQAGYDSMHSEEMRKYIRKIQLQRIKDRLF